MVDHSRMPLGLKAIKTDSRTFAFGSYLKRGLPAPPPSKDWTKGRKNWGDMLNSKLSCCSIAGIGHAIQIWTLNLGKMTTVPDATIKRYYSKWDGYDPKKPKTDGGGVELDVLNDWRRDKFAGHRLYAFADPKVKNLTEIRQSIALFRGVYVGLALPLTAQRQEIWTVASKAGRDAKWNSWGGHCVFIPKYDETSFTCITWGKLKTMTVDFWLKYGIEAHTLFGQDWCKSRLSPSGFDHDQLAADLKAL